MSKVNHEKVLWFVIGVLACLTVQICLGGLTQPPYQQESAPTFEISTAILSYEGSPQLRLQISKEISGSSGTTSLTRLAGTSGECSCISSLYSEFLRHYSAHFGVRRVIGSSEMIRMPIQITVVYPWLLPGWTIVWD